MLPSAARSSETGFVSVSAVSSLHFASAAASEEKQQWGQPVAERQPALFTSRTRYARLTRRLQQMDGELRQHTAAHTENDRMRALHDRGAITVTQQQQTDSGLGEGSAVDGLLAAVLAPSSHNGPHSGASAKQHYTGEALLHAMARLTQKDSKDDRQDAAKRPQQQPQQQAQPLQQTGQGQAGSVSSFRRSTAQQPHVVSHFAATGPQQQLPTAIGSATATTTLSAAAPTGAAPTAAAVSRSMASAAASSLAGGGPSDSDVWSVGQSAQLSVRAVLDYYRSHPAARSELRARVEALKAAKAAAASGAVDSNKRSMGQRDMRREQSERSREAEGRRQQAARERLRQAAVAASMQRQQLASSSTVRDRGVQRPQGTGHGSLSLEDCDGVSDRGSGGVGGSDGGRAQGGPAPRESVDESGDNASVDRRARSLWLSVAVPAAVGCSVWLERSKAAIIPRLAADLDSDVDVALSGLFHSALVARLQDSKDAALTVLKRSLASYGQRWQEKRRRKAATLILRFLTLVHTASAIRQALRETSVLTHILRIQRWWRRHSAVLHAQQTVLSKKWRRREAALARQLLHHHSSTSSTQQSSTPSGAGGAGGGLAGGSGGGGGGGAAAGQAEHHREANSRDRRRQPSFDARAGRYRTTVEQQQQQQQQRDSTSSSSSSGTASSSVGVGGQPGAVLAGDASAYKAIPRSAQQQGVCHLLAVRRAGHRRRLRVYFAQLAAYEQQYAQQLELIRTRRLLGMEGSDGSHSGASTATAAVSGTAAGHTLALPPAPLRPVFPLVPQNAEMDRLLIAASRCYFLSRLNGFRPDSGSFATPHRDAPSDEVDFTPAFCAPHNSATATASATAAAGNELSRVTEESESAVRPQSTQFS